MPFKNVSFSNNTIEEDGQERYRTYGDLPTCISFSLPSRVPFFPAIQLRGFNLVAIRLELGRFKLLVGSAVLATVATVIDLKMATWP